MRKIEDIPVTFLTTFGHCGVDWVHSLLDSHEELLIPPALSFYRCWKMLELSKAESKEAFINIWKQYINNFVGHNSKNVQKRIFTSKEQEEKFLDKFEECLGNNYRDRVAVFYAFHEAYAFVNKINLENVKAIVSHEHLPWPFETIINDFPKAKILMVVRDPRASVAGVFKGRVDDFGYLPDFTFNLVFDCWFQAMDKYKKYHSLLGENIKVIRNEDLHEDIDRHMKELAAWLGISFDNILTVSTYSSGEDYVPDSRYIKKGDTSFNYDTFYLPENVESRWRKVLSNKKDLVMIESVLSFIFKEFGYTGEYQDSILHKLKGVSLFLLPNYRIRDYWISEGEELEDYQKISRILKSRSSFLSVIWNVLPNKLKYLALSCFSIWRRVVIYLFSSNRWVRYDFENPLKREQERLGKCAVQN